MTTETKTATTEMSTKDFNKKVKSIQGRLKNIDNELQELALAAIFQVREHENTVFMSELRNKIGKTRLNQYLEFHTEAEWCGKSKVYKKPTDGFIVTDAADITAPWMEFKATAKPKTKAELIASVAKASKNAGENGATRAEVIAAANEYFDGLAAAATAAAEQAGYDVEALADSPTKKAA